MKINPNAQVKYPVSKNLLKSLRRFYIVILQYQVLPRLAYFQSSSSGKTTLLRQKAQKNNVMSEFQLNLHKHVNIW